MIRFAFITTHPIQYNAPLFNLLGQSDKYKVKVFYTWGQGKSEVFDPGFGLQRRWDINLLCGYEYKFVENISRDPGSHHYRGIINPHLISKINEFNPDAILVYGWNFHSHLKLMRNFKGNIPIIFRGDSTLLDLRPSFSFKYSLRKYLLKWVYSHVDFVLSPGTASDAYYRYAGLKPKQIFRAPHAVDNNFFQGDSTYTADKNSLQVQSAQWRKELGITQEKKVFLFAGKFETKKDPLILIEAFKQLLQRRSDIHLILAGDGILQPIIKSAIDLGPIQPMDDNGKSEIRVRHQITLLPFQNQSRMPLVYRLADVFVLPSKGPGETWGLAVNEAMASGKAVIVSDKCGCASDLVKPGVNGYIFPSGNVQELVNAMESSLKEDAYKVMGQRSLQHIQSFSYTSFLGALQSIPLGHEN